MRIRYHKNCGVERFWDWLYDESPDPKMIEKKTPIKLFHILLPYLLGLAGVSLILWFHTTLIPGLNSTTVALSYLIVVLLAASYGGLGPGIFASLAGMLCFNYFFLPPLGTLNIHDPQNWIALMAFLFTAFIASELSSAARLRALEAERHRQEEGNLYQFSRAIILTPDPQIATTSIARQVLEIFRLKYCGIFLRKPEGFWERLSVANEPDVEGAFEPSTERMDQVFAAESIQEEVAINTNWDALYVPLKLGVKGIGAMVFLSPKLDRTVIEAIAGLVALAMERARFLNELSFTKALQQSDELKSAILASISHDLRTPLTSMRAAVDSLIEENVVNNQEELREFHMIIREDVARLSHLVENLLEMARIESSGLQLSKQWESVPELFHNVMIRCEKTIQNHRIRIDNLEDLPLVKMDSRLLSQVLSNLIENAAKYSPQGTEILLRAWIDEGNLLFSVKDQGAGIPREEMTRIFEKFYRLKEPGSRSGGTGMGLAIARGIVQAHGGTIWVESTPGKGSTFFCKIPVEQKAQILSV